MANNQNLKPWKPGQSGNPAGKPKGTKHISTLIQELLNDEKFSVSVNGKRYRGVPIKAMIKTQVILAMDGNTRAFDILLKHGWGKIEPDPKDMPPNPIHFYNVVPTGPPYDDEVSLPVNKPNGGE